MEIRISSKLLLSHCLCCQSAAQVETSISEQRRTAQGVACEVLPTGRDSRRCAACTSPGWNGRVVIGRGDGAAMALQFIYPSCIHSLASSDSDGRVRQVMCRLCSVLAARRQLPCTMVLGTKLFCIVEPAW